MKPPGWTFQSMSDVSSRISKETGEPLYVQIQNIILDEIRSGTLSPGSPIYSEHELAARLDVSRLTVRRAYGEMVNKGLLYSIHGKGTYVSADAANSTGAQSPSDRRRLGTTLAVVFPEISQFFGPILHSIEDEAKAKGMQIQLIFNSSLRSENDAIDRVLATESTGGLIITPYRRSTQRSYSKYMDVYRSGIPTVMVGKPPFHLHFDSVYCDDVVATFDLVSELRTRGHERVAWLMDSSGDAEAIAERKEGYLRALAEGSASGTATLIDTVTPAWEGNLVELMGKPDRPTAIASDNDMSAARALNLLLANGFRVPEEVSIVGFDNYELCETLSVPLSSMSQPRAEMGRRAFELLREQIGREESQRRTGVHHIVLVPTLVERNSTRSIP